MCIDIYMNIHIYKYIHILYVDKGLGFQEPFMGISKGLF